MTHSILPQILDRAGDQFYRVDHKWQPKDLIPDPYRRNLLKNAQARFNELSQGESEFRTLDRAHVYIKILRSMRIQIKDAQFAWRSDDLRFLTSISNFFRDYGLVMRFLKEDDNRGRVIRRQKHAHSSHS